MRCVAAALRCEVRRPGRVNYDSGLPAPGATQVRPRGRTAGHGADLLHLRPHTSGDDLRRLHWRKSAQLGSWVVTVRER